MANGPSDTIGRISTAAFSDIKTKMKDMKKEVREAQKDFDKLKKAAKETGQTVSKNSDQAKRLDAANNNLNSFVSEVKESNKRKAEFIEQNRLNNRSFMDSVDDAYSRVNTIRGIGRKIHKVINEFKDDSGHETIGKDLSGNDIIIDTGTTTGYKANKAASDLAYDAFLVSWKAKNPVGMALSGLTYAGTKLFTGVQDAAKAESLDPLYQRQEKQDYAGSGLGGAANFEQIKGAAERDYLRKNFDAQLLSGLGGEAIARKQVELNPDATRAMHQSVEGAINQISALRQSALSELESGNKIGYDIKMKQARELIPNERIEVYADPLALYTQREASREGAKSWARSQLSRAGPRTGD